MMLAQEVFIKEQIPFAHYSLLRFVLLLPRLFYSLVLSIRSMEDETFIMKVRSAAAFNHPRLFLLILPFNLAGCHDTASLFPSFSQPWPQPSLFLQLSLFIQQHFPLALFISIAHLTLFIPYQCTVGFRVDRSASSQKYVYVYEIRVHSVAVYVSKLRFLMVHKRHIQRVGDGKNITTENRVSFLPSSPRMDSWMMRNRVRI